MSVQQTSPPQQLRQQTSNCSLLLIYRPRKDERLSWPSAERAFMRWTRWAVAMTVVMLTASYTLTLLLLLLIICEQAAACLLVVSTGDDVSCVVVDVVSNHHLLSAGAARCRIHSSLQWSLDTAWLRCVSSRSDNEVGWALTHIVTSLVIMCYKWNRFCGWWKLWTYIAYCFSLSLALSMFVAAYW